VLLGHSDDFTEDKDMKVTVAFNRFGPGLVQRMPR
jgi:pectate lyase